MVVKGGFSVRLVEAHSKEPFPEHTHTDGTIYAEVEPGAEYFIEVKMLESAKQTLSAERVRVKFYADGKYLECTKQLNPHKRKCYKAYYSGSRSEHQGISTQQALRFATPTIKFDTGTTTTTTEVNSKPSFGEVKVKIFEAVDTGKRETKTNQTHSHSGPVITAGTISASLVQGEKKKLLRTTAGDYSEAKKTKRPKNVFKSGKQLESITIRYCTALGLVQAGFFAQQDDTSQTETVEPETPKSSERKPRRRVKRENANKENDPSQSEVIDVDDDTDRKPSAVKREAGEDNTVASGRKAKRVRGNGGTVSQADKFVDLSCLSDED